jgi:hypothetical protein
MGRAVLDLVWGFIAFVVAEHLSESLSRRIDELL